MSVDEMKQACEAMGSNTESNSRQNESGDAIHFLKSVTTSCKVLGHTTEATKEARRKVYAMSERFGSHSIFLTITPDDQCCFKVRLFASNGEEIKIPSLNCLEGECLEDFSKREEKRIKYPGACSMYYQEFCHMICHLLGWDYLGIDQKALEFLVNASHL